MEREDKKLVETVYYLENVTSSMQVEEYIQSYVCGMNEEGISSESRKEKLTVDLGKFRFAVYPVKNQDANERIVLLKTTDMVGYRSELGENDFKASHCFVILYPSDKKFNFIFEELLEEIIGKIDYYRKL